MARKGGGILLATFVVLAGTMVWFLNTTLARRLSDYGMSLVLERANHFDRGQDEGTRI